MFDEVTRVEGGKRAARKGAYIFGSTVFQIVFVLALVVVGERIRSAAKAEASVEVKFIRAAPPPPPPPPAPKKRSDPKPKTDAPKPVLPPAAMIQPKEIAEEMKPPNPNEPPEPEPEAEGGSEGGVVGGVAIEEAPRYVGAGFRAPREKERGCLQTSMRVPPALTGFVSGSITVKFAVRRDGSIGQVQIMSQLPDPRIADIIRQGLSRCEWVPGADAQGNVTSLWVIQPIRFTGG